MTEIAQELGRDFSGPVIFNYLWWVLWKAKKYGVKQLYFLARDGFTLYRIAELFCRRFDLGIKCSYLYCSRTALRMPSYFFIGDEAFDLLFLRGYRMTLKSLLQRGELTEEERQDVYRECGMDGVNEDQILSHGDLAQYECRIKESNTFRKCIIKRSRSAYMNAIGYLEAEGLKEQSTIAIVDSGWTGSMQRSLRQILEFSGYSGGIIGFYFGMYANPKARADGEYLTWYFDARTKAKEKAFFCNNLFECLLSAPHGMTVSYRKTDGGYEPVLLPGPEGEELVLISEQSELICKYAAEKLEQITFYEFDAATMLRDTSMRIKRYMFKPTRAQASYYGQFLFCDDVTESYHLALAASGQKDILKNYSVVRRFFRRLTKRPLKEKAQAELFWPYGTVSFLSLGKQWWYRVNIYTWEWLKQRIYTIGNKSCGTAVDIETYKREIKCHEVISFDIFDTLLYRIVNRPTDVFRLMEPSVDEIFGMQDFCAKRIAAEKAARRLSEEEEITLADIYSAFKVSHEEAGALAQCECKTELAVLRRDSIMAELLSYSVAIGKKVLIISDMYQSEKFLRAALSQAGIYEYDALYVSSAEKVAKVTGKLFRTVAKKERITDYKQWLHIGNDFYSDYVIPKALGLSSLPYDNGRALGDSCNSGLRCAVSTIKVKARISREMQDD